MKTVCRVDDVRFRLDWMSFFRGLAPHVGILRKSHDPNACDAKVQGRSLRFAPSNVVAERDEYQRLLGIRAITLISKSNPASQVTPIAVQLG